jgi:hypothetical protein
MRVAFDVSNCHCHCNFKVYSLGNLEGEEIVDAPGKYGNASMPEQVKRPNLWRKMVVMMMMMEP